MILHIQVILQSLELHKYEVAYLVVFLKILNGIFLLDEAFDNEVETAHDRFVVYVLDKCDYFSTGLQSSYILYVIVDGGVSDILLCLVINFLLYRHFL